MRAAPLQDGRPSGEVLVGVRKHVARGLVDLYFLGGPGLGSAFDMPALRFLAGASFATDKLDQRPASGEAGPRSAVWPDSHPHVMVSPGIQGIQC